MKSPFLPGPRAFASTLALWLAAGAASAALFGPAGKDADEKRAGVRAQRDAIIQEAVKARPELRDRLKQAAGYATFRQTDVNLFLLASGNGYGVVVENATGKETYMRMASLGGGVGMGVKDLRILFVFTDPKVMSQFLEQGWQFGGKADASAKYQDTGVSAEQAVKANVDTQSGSVTAASSTDARAGARGKGSEQAATGIAAGMEVYQFTESGISLQATVQGTKYWKDSKLNE